MLKPSNGCPSGFKEGSLVLGVPSSDHSELYNIDTESSEGEFTLKFCTKEDTTSTDTQWEPGQYCILGTKKECPSGTYYDIIDTVLDRLLCSMNVYKDIFSI